MHSFGPMLSALVAALLVFAPTNSQRIPSSFELRKEYFFNYAGYALSGRPPAGNYSGFKINAKICLLPIMIRNGGFHMQLKIKKARYEQVDGDISPLRPEQGDSPELLTKESALTNIPIDLSRIVHFNWVNGYVKDVRVDKKDQQWIKNLKKGILNMLNFNLRRLLKTDDDGQATMVKWQSENGAEGDCRTGYVSTKQKKGITLQKIRDLYSCNERYAQIHSFMKGESCTRDNSIFGTPLRGESRTTFDLPTVSKTKFFLRSSKTVAQYYLPNPNTGCLLAGSYITQELKFLSIGRKPKVPKAQLQPGLVAIDIANNVTRAWLKKSSEERRAKIDRFLGDVKKMGNDEKLNIVLRDLVSTLRLASVEDLNYMLEQAKKQGQRVETIVYDIFGAIGTYEARNVTFSKILDEKVSDSRASCLLRMLSFSTVEWKYLLKMKLMKLAQNPKLKAKNRVETLQTLWMMVGTLHCRDSRSSVKDKSISKWFQDQFRAKHPAMDTDAKTTTMLMAIGNAGALPSLKVLLKRGVEMKKANKLTLHMRLHGLHAMRKFAASPNYKLQTKMRTILWPLFANPMEDSELRIMAFQYLVKTNPSRRHMSILMSQLRNEPCRHVRSYVISYLKLLARSGRMSPCRTRIAKLVRWALPTLPKNKGESGMFKSRIMFMPLMKSTGYYISIIYCTHSSLPRSVTIGQLFADDQSEINVWSLTLRSLESGTLLRNIAEPSDSILGRMETLFREFKGSKGKKKEAQTTAHFSLSGEDAGYYGTTFLGSKSNPLRALQLLLKMGKTSAIKAMYMDSAVHLPTSFGATLNWLGSGISVQQMSSKFSNKKGMQMTASFGTSILSDTSLGFTSGNRCAHTSMQAYLALHPGKPQDVTMNMEMTDKGMRFSIHGMPHKNEMQAMRSGVRYYQVIMDGSGKTMKRPLYPIVDSRKTEKEMMRGFIRVQTVGVSRSGFNRVTSRGERTPAQMMKRMDTPFSMVVNRVSRFCGMSLDFKIKKWPGKPDPMRTTRIGAIKVKLANVDGGKIRGSPSRIYKPPLDLRRFAKAQATVSLSLYRMSGMKRSEVKIGVASLEVGGAGESLDIKMKPRMGKVYTLLYTRRVVGALPIYDVNNPLTVTANSGSEGNVVIKEGEEVVAKLTRTSSISNYWIEEWKRLLLNPADVASTWPDVYRCYQDLQDKYYGSPSCYSAWRQLQTFDNVSSTVLSPYPNCQVLQESIAQWVSQFYTFIQRSKSKNRDGLYVSRISASFCPSDMRAVDNNRKYYARVIDGYPRWATCTVSYYQKTRQFYTRTFDGLNYISNLPRPSSKGKSFIMVRDCKRGSFTISVGSDKQGSRFVMALGNFGGKKCKAMLTDDKGKPNFDFEGSGCENNFELGSWGQVNYLNMKPLGVKLAITGKLQFSIMVNRMMYMNSLHGFCGNFDREPEHMELLGCKNGKVKYFSNDRKGWDGLLKSYMTKDPANFKDC